MKDNPKDVNKNHTLGWAPLHVAAANNKHQHIEVLLKHGADPNISEGFSNVFHVSHKLRTNLADGNYKVVLVLTLIAFRKNYFVSNILLIDHKINNHFFLCL